MRQRIGKRAVAALPASANPEFVLWDTEIRGFCVRVFPSGRKAYYLRQWKQRRQVTRKIGLTEALSPDQARQIAKQLSAAFERGEAIGPKKQEPLALTVTELVDRYLTEGPIDRPDKRPSSWANDRSYLRNHAVPLLGKRRIDELTAHDLSRFQADVLGGKTARPKGTGKGYPVTGGKGAAVHAVRSLSAALGWAVRRDLLRENVASKMTKLTDGARERYLSEGEVERLLEAMDRLRDERRVGEDHLECIELIFLTGARKTEIAALRWSEVDLERRLLILPPLRHKTGGTNVPKVIPLSSRSADILSARWRRRAAEEMFVFPSPTARSGHVSLRHVWSVLTEEADLKDFRIHDFRHAYASFAINAGMSLKEIGANLGHKKVTTTERYAHLVVETRRPVADRIDAVYRGARRQR
ncbi:tyrosine-type recombinase/integrase [Parvularcula oceani]|uniref:tyrosine-type recombinase/integrase n=1 Tax=Parvularcula oceani TaxID=1247963 RepID=UPI000566533E|nr:site-specific integrase [Parvularcula oceani]